MWSDPGYDLLIFANKNMEVVVGEITARGWRGFQGEGDCRAGGAPWEQGLGQCDVGFFSEKAGPSGPVMGSTLMLMILLIRVIW